MVLAPNCLASSEPLNQAKSRERFVARPSVPEILYIIKNYLDDALALYGSGLVNLPNPEL
jgi:hypothetical protein